MKKILFFALSILFFASCSDESTTSENIPSASDAIPVKVMPLGKVDILNPVYVSGQFTTTEESTLSFKTGGVIENVFVQQGDRVQSGQLIAKLVLTEINAQVEQARIGLDKAKRDFDRGTKLLQDSVITTEQYENLKTFYDLSSKQYEAAKFNLSYSEIRATSSGVILERFANAGQIVGPGSPIVRFNALTGSDWVVRAAIADKDWSRVVVGDSATLKINALNLHSIKGTVIRKSEGVDPYTGLFLVDIRPSQTLSNLASGLFAEAIISPRVKQNSWQIPLEAVLDGDGKQGFVFITNDEKKAERVKVSISSIAGGMASVVSGLDNAQWLIVSGGPYLNDQSSILIQK
jgi:RND family efflux transporter MFP subunit